MRYFLLFTLFVITTIQLSGQSNKHVPLSIAGTHQYPSARILSVEDRKVMIEDLEKFINDYRKAAVFSKNNGITKEILADFEQFFNINIAAVVKDFEQKIEPTTVSITDYGDKIYSYFDQNSFIVQLKKAELFEIVDQDKFFDVRIRVDKTRLTCLQKSGKVVPTNDELKQEFIISIRKSDLKDLKIISIRQLNISSTSNGENYLGLTLSLFNPTKSPEFSNHWNEQHSESNLSINSSFGFSAGLELLKKIGDKNLFLSLGLRYQFQKMESGLDNFGFTKEGYPTASNGETLTYDRIISEVSAVEVIKTHAIEIPIGLAYRLNAEDSKLGFFLAGRLIPQFGIGSSSSITGVGTYDASLDASMWRYLETLAANQMQQEDLDAYGPLMLGEDLVINQTANPTLRGFALSAQLSPQLIWHFSKEKPTWSALMGIDITLPITSLMTFDAVEGDMLIYNTDYQTSLLQHYLQDNSGIVLGFRLGLLYQK